MLLEISTGTSAAAPDPGSGAFLTPLDPGWEKSESGINVPDHIYESLVTILWVKNTTRCHPVLLIRIRDPVLFFTPTILNPGSKKSRSGMNIPDP